MHPLARLRQQLGAVRSRGGANLQIAHDVDVAWRELPRPNLQRRAHVDPSEERHIVLADGGLKLLPLALGQRCARGLQVNYDLRGGVPRLVEGRHEAVGEFCPLVEHKHAHVLVVDAQALVRVLHQDGEGDVEGPYISTT